MTALATTLTNRATVNSSLQGAEMSAAFDRIVELERQNADLLAVAKMVVREFNEQAQIADANLSGVGQSLIVEAAKAAISKATGEAS